MSKHTKGPWDVKTNRHPNTDGTPWGWVEGYPHPAGGAGYPPSGMSTITWSGKQGLANARLISAAPELAEALGEALTELRTCRRNIATEFRRGIERWEGVPEILDQRIAACEAALRKAGIE